MNRLQVILVSVFAAAWLIVCPGCGSSDNGSPKPDPKTGQTQVPADPPSQAADLDPRKLVTEEEATLILGQAVKFTEPEKIGQFASTRMENDKGNMIATLQVSTASYTLDKFKSDVEESAKMLDAKFEPVEDLGESAYWMDGLMQVFAKGKWVQVTVPMRPGLEPQTAAKSLLEKALSRLE